MSNLSREAARPKCVSRVTERLNWLVTVLGAGSERERVKKNKVVFGKIICSSKTKNGNKKS